MTTRNTNNEERLIRRQPKEKQDRIKLLVFECDNSLFVDVHRERYNDDIKGFFIRRNKGVTVIVNDNMLPREQATTIRRLVKGSNICADSVIGMIGENNKYVCECGFCLSAEV